MNDLQRTREWYLDRRGKITASECHLLLNNRKEPMTEEELAEWKKANPKSRVTTKEVPFSTGTFTYLDGKIAEMYMPDDAFMMYIENCKFENAAMRWGTTLEDDARKRYQLEMNVDVFDAPFIHLQGFERFAGGSPDGVIGQGEGIIEIKCPFTPQVHLAHYMMEKPEDLAELNPQYYAQCQYNMLCVEYECGIECEYCDFISFDPRMSADKQIKILRVWKDAEMQKSLLERTRLAIEYFREQLGKIESIESKIINHYE